MAYKNKYGPFNSSSFNEVTIEEAHLFEQAQRAMHIELPVSAELAIATSYFDAGDAATARVWLEAIPELPNQINTHDVLLLKVLQRLGDVEAAAQVTWRVFSSLQNLQSVSREDKEYDLAMTMFVVLTSIQALLNTDATFFIRTGRLAEAETYVFTFRNLLEQVDDVNLLQLAEDMEAEARWLAATVIYRALSETILRRGDSKNYQLCVHYLRQLAAIAQNISNWQKYEPHKEFIRLLRHKHVKKLSFWAKYADVISDQSSVISHQ